MQETIIKVTIDKTAKGVKLFKKIKNFTLTKIELFKHAVFMYEIPEHIKDSDFEYLQSKLPALDSLYSDFIDLQPNTIINLSNDDRQKKNNIGSYMSWCMINIYYCSIKYKSKYF